MNADHENYIQTKYTTKNPNFSVIDKISNEYITDHNKKYYLFLNNDFSIHNNRMINLKRYLLKSF